MTDIKLQQKIHPDLKPYTTSRPAAEVFEAAKAVCSELFSSVVDVDDARMEVECVDVTKLMRYKDDVIVRVSKGADGTRVDVRSASRVGKGDLGKNAQRVGEFYAALRAKLEQ